MSGRMIDRFEVTGDLGETGFGSVLRGRDSKGGQEVQIQLCTVDDPELRRRFYAEAAGVAKLRHPHVVEVRGVGFDGEVPFLAEELLPRSLDQILEQRPPWSAGGKLALLQQIGKGLAYGHARGLQHLELRPDQVRLANIDGRHVAKVAGFGVARLVSTENRLARTGVTLETAVYLPPEQIRGGSVDHRVDIFAFGVVAYELLTYERPFRGQNLSGLVYQILYKDPQPMTAAWADCPASLEEIVSRCLSKKADDRVATMDAVLGDIDGFLRQAHGRWAALEKPYQAIPSVTRDISDTEVTRSQLARTARDLGAKGSGGAETVRIPMEPAERVDPFAAVEATQSLPALGDETPSPSASGESASVEKPGETTVSLPSPPKAIPPDDLVEQPAPPPQASEPPPEKKREGVDTRPVGRQTVRLDAIPVVTPNRPVPPSPPPPDELPTVTSVKPGGGIEPDEMPTVVSADELAAIVAATAAAPGPPVPDPTVPDPAVSDPVIPSPSPADEMPTVLGGLGDELPTVMSTQPLAALAIAPTDTVDSPEEPTLVGGSVELPDPHSPPPEVVAGPASVSPPAEEGDEPTLVTSSSELPTTVLPSSEDAEDPTLVTSSSELPTTLLPTGGGGEEPTLVTEASELPTALLSTPPPSVPEPPPPGPPPEAAPEATFVAPLAGSDSPPGQPPVASPASAEAALPTPVSGLDQAAFAPPDPAAPPDLAAQAPASGLEAPLAAFEAPAAPGSSPVARFDAPLPEHGSSDLPSLPAPPSPIPASPTPASPMPGAPGSTGLSQGSADAWGQAPSAANPFAQGSSGAQVASPSSAFSPPSPQQPAPTQPGAVSDPGSVVLSQAPPGPTATSQTPASGRSGLAKGLLIGLGVVALVGLLAVAGGIWWWMGRADRVQTPEAQVVSAPPRPAPPVAADAPRGHVTVLASPWGRVVEITDEAGFVLPQPDDPHTPLLLELVPGRYRITVQYGDDPSALTQELEGTLPEGTVPEGTVPEGAASAEPATADESIARGEPIVCEVEVRLDSVARCQVAFEAPSATDYFKEVGWWQ